ncbi:hypothetical protein Tco_0120616, partial [Tanacetum coccineum]
MERGDFNEVRNQEDRLNTQFQEKEVDDFNDFITTATLMEIPLGGRKSTAIALDRKESYHYQIVLKDIFVDFGPKPFRVFDIWLEDPGEEKIISRSDQTIDEYRIAAMRWKVEAESTQLEETEMREWTEARRNSINKDREK